MNTDTWARAKVLFGQAMEQPPHERRAWLERAGAAADVEALVWTLVESSETLDGFLDSPVVVPQEDIEAVAAGAAVVPTEDDAAVAADARRLQPGTRLGRFDIVRELGHGGMGVVYLAHATHLGCDVALKALPPEASKDPLNRDRFTLEARAAAKINHPGVARVFDFDEIEGQLFIVSEFVDGRSLRKELAEGPLPQERAVALAIEIADALHAAHEAGVVHRDLKPDNVMLTRTGSVKVVDFGIAYVANSDDKRLTVHGAIGTPAYMAPEQAAGEPGDARTDVYAIGLVLSEMLSGQRPFAPQPPLPAAFAPIVARCRQVDPAARFQSAASLRDALLARQKDDSRDRWWWLFHQAATIVAYALLLMPSWLARRAVTGPTIGGLAGRWLFAVVLAAGIVAITLRLHLLFVSRAGARAVEEQRSLSANWLRAADLTFAAGLVVSGLLVENLQAPLAVLLIAAGAVAGVSSLFIEPATSRAAFDQEAATEGSRSR